MAKVTPTAIDLQRVDRMIDTAKNSRFAIRDTLAEVLDIRDKEREKTDYPGAAAYIHTLETAISTMLPEGTAFDEVLDDPSKWKAEKKDK